MPEHKVAPIIAFSTAWGMLLAAAQSFSTVLVDRKPVRDGWFPIVVIEFLLVLSLIDAIFHHWLLELILPAALAAAVTYGSVYLIAGWPELVKRDADVTVSN